MPQPILWLSRNSALYFYYPLELVEKLKRIHTLSKRIARGVLPEEPASRVE